MSLVKFTQSNASLFFLFQLIKLVFCTSTVLYIYLYIAGAQRQKIKADANRFDPWQRHVSSHLIG